MTDRYPDTPLHRAIAGGDFPVLVSLARHDLDLARAALDGGASAIKVHLNAYHRASGTTFGSFAEERPFLEQLAGLGCPLLVMAGQETLPSEGELDALADIGFEGFNVYIDHLRPHLLASRLRPIPALGEASGPADVARIAAIPGAMVEVSVVPFAGYGERMTDADLARYRAVAETTGLPVIAPSQRRFVPGDMPRLREAGVAAVLLGAIVTGRTAEEVRRTVAAMVRAAD